MRYLIFILSICFLLPCCNYLGGERISGNGRVVTESVNSREFTAVQISGSINVRLKQQPQTTVRVQADENLLEYIDIYTDGNTLFVKTKQGYNLRPSEEIVVFISAPVFKEIGLSGSGNVSSENTIAGSEALSLHLSGSGDMQMHVNAQKIQTTIDGSGSMELQGTTEKLEVSVDGSGYIKAFNLSAQNTDVDLSGSADAQVVANKNLNIHISGSGSVQYKGNASVQQKIAGSGSVEKIG